MAPLLKNLYNEEYLELLSSSIQNEFTAFDISGFKNSVFDKDWSNRELKNRMRHISSTLGHYLPNNYENAISILQRTFRKINFDYSLQNMIFQDFVEVYGLDNLEISLDALECFTINSSSEFAIRAFIIKYPEVSMKRVLLWTKSENEHIRRLASEGSRPRLPWAIALPVFKENPKQIIEVLELLKDDESEYVRKSVSNSLNDISKDNPEIAKKLSKKWIKHSKNRDALVKHGCRTLLKDADAEVLKLFKYADIKDVKLENFMFSHNTQLGEELSFSFMLNSKENLGKLRLEFAIEFLRKNGSHNKKVFKIAEGNYNERTKFISKTYSFRPISTRAYYVGEHYLNIMLNGILLQRVSFSLKP